MKVKLIDVAEILALVETYLEYAISISTFLESFARMAVEERRILSRAALKVYFRVDCLIENMYRSELSVQGLRAELAELVANPLQ